MSGTVQDRLYELLPAVYRLRDAARGQPLHALLNVIESEVQLLEDDIGRLYANWFIETCDEWIVPYLGDLLDVRNLHPLQGGVFSQRAYVANTLAYRRRKGTAAMLEQLAHDVTGWPAKAVEFFEVLGATQYLKHMRPGKGGTIDLRDGDRLELIDGPFERAAHTVEVRHIDNGRGRYNIPNLGLFLWRLQAYPIERGTGHAVTDPADWRYTFQPLGYDIPLVNTPQTETQVGQLTDEVNVPGPLRRRPLHDELEARRQALLTGKTPPTLYFGAQPVLAVHLDRNRLLPEQIVICNLAGWRRPASRSFTRFDGTTYNTEVAVDPALGRLALLGGGAPPRVEVSYAYGFSGDVGGGPYDRRQSPAQGDGSGSPDTVANPYALAVRIGVPSDQPTLADALAAWNTEGSQPAVIEIEDNATHALPPAGLTINMAGDTLILQAANRRRPALIGDIAVTGGGNQAGLTLNGLLLAGSLHVQGTLAALNIAHCTLAPGTALAANGLFVEPPNDHLELAIDHSIVAALRVPGQLAGLTIQDSIIQAPSRRIPALVSDRLDPFPTLTSTAPTVNIAIGDEGPYPIRFSSVPTTLAHARRELEAAIQSASSNPAFAKARVVAADERLIVLCEGVGPVTVTPAETAGGVDGTAAELRLTLPGARPVNALLSGRLSPFPALSSITPALQVAIGSDGPYVAHLLSAPDTLAAAASALQKAVRDASPASTFQGTLVTPLDDRLVVLPAADAAEIAFAATPTDKTTLAQLALEGEPLAIGAAESGERVGPATSLERTTVLGAVTVRELTLASEVIFDGRVLAERHQAGCVRFSFVPEGSRTPRRYRCQPDLALAQRAQALQKDSISELPAAERSAILARIRPSFTSRRYGQPAFAQLSLSCAEEIRTGAEDGSEMGVFSFLKQPQREANLRTSLDEYLRFGLEAGIFYSS